MDDEEGLTFFFGFNRLGLRAKGKPPKLSFVCLRVGGDHRSKYRDDVIAPRRQDMNPVFRSADILVAPAHPFPLRVSRESERLIVLRGYKGE